MTAVPLSHSVGVAGEAAGRPREVLAHPLAFQLDGAFDLGLKLQVAPEGGVGKAADQGTVARYSLLGEALESVNKLPRELGGDGDVGGAGGRSQARV